MSMDSSTVVWIRTVFLPIDRHDDGVIHELELPSPWLGVELSATNIFKRHGDSGEP